MGGTGVEATSYLEAAVQPGVTRPLRARDHHHRCLGCDGGGGSGVHSSIVNNLEREEVKGVRREGEEEDDEEKDEKIE
ncbi:hypothetical protein E2C01_045419 [Portunus trituberculatus]|uniref:Uncharacterized protein n=1 Tax=Portunus trituberculatus TaxID=210409 RepID=A0A5B7FUY3_PORTR|nr:hypothetical protein [Portunus trituberculatus]